MAKSKILSPQEKLVAKSKRESAKADNFKKLATKRVSKLLAQIENVRKLSNKNSYTYTPEQVTKIITALSESFKGLESSFKNHTAKTDAFSL